jgi:uncharacterized protein
VVELRSMTSSRSRCRTQPIRAVALLLALVLAATVAPATTAEAQAPATTAGLSTAGLPTGPNAFDYTRVRGLTQPTHGNIIRQARRVRMGDGVELYVEIVRPQGKGPFPVILEASPYHGTLADRDGTRILPEPRDAQGNSIGLTGYFAPRGYAVVMVDLRGTGRSGGCLDHLGPADARDLKRIVQWAASRGWSNGKVGMTGHSYVGSTPSLAAAMRPKGLATIVPSAGLASMYDHQFQGGVPYFLQWIGPMVAYEQLAIERFVPGGDSDDQNHEYAGCGMAQSALVAGPGQVTGAYSWWHAERDWRAAATAAPVPVFMVHGVNDNAARVPAMQWFTDRGGRRGDKLWLGQWDHGSGYAPTRRGIQWTAALHAWFDKHLAGRNVRTGPAVELFMSDDETLAGGITGYTEVLRTRRWPVPASTLELFPDAGGSMARRRPAAEGSASFSGTPASFADPQSGGVTFSTKRMGADRVLAGVPELDLVASVSAPEVHLIANLYDEAPSGQRRRISQFAITPALREGLSTPAPVVPGQRYTMRPPAFAMAHHLRTGHRLVLRVTTSDPDKAPTLAVDPDVTVYTGPGGTAVRVPVAEEGTLVPDNVPIAEGEQPAGPAGPAQPTIREHVAAPAPGAGERIEPLTSGSFEFDIDPLADNARAEIVAVPSAPADLDLYLSVLVGDEWVQVAAGETGSLNEEVISLTAPAGGRYKLEVHNWAGVLLDGADVTITFRNRNGEPGPG